MSVLSQHIFFFCKRYVCVPCSDLQLRHRGGIYTQVQADRSHNVRCIKSNDCFFGSEWSCCLLVHQPLRDREWQREITNREGKALVLPVRPWQTDSSVCWWTGEESVLCFSLSGLQKAMIGWDILHRLLQTNKHTEAQKSQMHMHGHFMCYFEWIFFITSWYAFFKMCFKSITSHLWNEVVPQCQFRLWMTLQVVVFLSCLDVMDSPMPVSANVQT